MDKPDRTMELLGPNVRGVFRVNGSTTAAINDAGEVVIRQVRRVAIPADEPIAPGAIHQVEETEVLVKLPAADLALIGRMVGTLHGSEA